MTARRRPRARAYYNEWEAYPAEWLRRLMQAGLIMKGVVNEQDIQKVRPSSLAGYERCHFFAGIGGWELALQLAGWPEGSEVWTGSCPCQPFSLAGKRKGTQDVKHVWPVWRARIARYIPPVIFGEQVASPLGREWLAGVRADLEALGYEVGAADLCAASAGAPHIRQRLFWVADSELPRVAERWRVAGIGTSTNHDAGIRELDRDGCTEQTRAVVAGQRCSESYWRQEPEPRPLVDGVPGRVGLLRGYGNAICPQAAAAFIEAWLCPSARCAGAAGLSTATGRK